ncbi:MAG: hypothetical protein Unbinned221contig1000_11 [Prokaryotic dsDNA virus sp.]|nr:MAG: hypothetical protein Unbinned221contig1000_11 [Prokaryotic dsDNA virus sp.]|tara:strand:+ start:254 stop:703 length:450 start_codon:yes stop_codon:yes gene_type:complete
MKYFDVINKIKDHLENDPIVTTTSQGDILDLDLSKATLFPLAHIIVNNVTIGSQVTSYNVSIIGMDVVNFSKEKSSGFEGNDNELYILNTQLEVMKRICAVMTRGDLYRDGFELDGEPTAEPFTDRFENVVAGFTLSMTVRTPNEMTSC